MRISILPFNRLYQIMHKLLNWKIVISTIILFTLSIALLFIVSSIWLSNKIPNDGIDLELTLNDSGENSMSYCYVGQGPGVEMRDLGDPNLFHEGFYSGLVGIGFPGVPRTPRNTSNENFIRGERGSILNNKAVMFYGTDKNGILKLHISKKILMESLSYRLNIRVQCKNGETAGHQAIGIRPLGTLYPERFYTVTMRTINGNPEGSESIDWMRKTIKNTTPSYGKDGSGIGYSNSVQ
jgi:hypothetical protein